MNQDMVNTKCLPSSRDQYFGNLGLELNFLTKHEKQKCYHNNLLIRNIFRNEIISCNVTFNESGNSSGNNVFVFLIASATAVLLKIFINHTLFIC